MLGCTNLPGGRGVTKLTIQKWGNSLAVRIPATIAEEVGVKQGSAVELAADQDPLFFKVIRRKKAGITLDQLLAQVTPENRHTLIDPGPAVGREILQD